MADWDTTGRKEETWLIGTLPVARLRDMADWDTTGRKEETCLIGTLPVTRETWLIGTLPVARLILTIQIGSLIIQLSSPTILNINQQKYFPMN